VPGLQIQLRRRRAELPNDQANVLRQQVAQQIRIKLESMGFESTQDGKKLEDLNWVELHQIYENERYRLGREATV
jgi:hypothetical protein